MESDYAYKARCQSRFKVLVESDPEFATVFQVPAVVPELSTDRVLATELVHGVHIDQACSHHALAWCAVMQTQTAAVELGILHEAGCM